MYNLDNKDKKNADIEGVFGCMKYLSMGMIYRHLKVIIWVFPKKEILFLFSRNFNVYFRQNEFPGTMSSNKFSKILKKELKVKHQ